MRNFRWQNTEWISLKFCEHDRDNDEHYLLNMTKKQLTTTTVVYFDQQAHACACVCMVENKKCLRNRSTVAQMAAHSPHDRKVVGLNPAVSYETVFLSESRIDALTCDNKIIWYETLQYQSELGQFTSWLF